MDELIIDVDLSEGDILELIKARNTWIGTEEWKKRDATDVEEYFIKRYAPNIHAKVRKALGEQAPSIWGERFRE